MYEGRWIFIILILANVASETKLFHSFLPPVITGGLLLFCLWFFRDPERKPPNDTSLAVSPADGTVTLVDEVEEEQFFKRRMKRISIFLSVFDVHVNRTPIAGEVLFTEGRGGLYLDARKPEASVLNESLYWVFGSKERMEQAVGVKQITGAIARRIVPWAKVGEPLVRGERFGMIRFGSRTDLYLPLDSEVLVAVGQKVKGGETPVARMDS
jgi:phosphatidylserine decarboxylase